MAEKSNAKKLWRIDEINALIREGKYFGPQGAIFITEVCYPVWVTDNLVEGRSAASSVYYSAATHLWARGGVLDRLSAARYLKKALGFSNKMLDAAGSIKKLSANQLDIRQSILRRALQGGEALGCIQEGLSRPDVSLMTRALLLCGVLDIQARRRRSKEANVAYVQIQNLLKGELGASDDHMQLARVYRALSIYASGQKSHDEAERYRKAAEQHAAFVPDQQLKLQGI